MKIMKELVQALYEYLMMLSVTTAYASAQGVIGADNEHSDRSYESIPMCNMERRRECQRGKIALYFACRGHYQ